MEDGRGKLESSEGACSQVIGASCLLAFLDGRKRRRAVLDERWSDGIWPRLLLTEQVGGEAFGVAGVAAVLFFSAGL